MNHKNISVIIPALNEQESIAYVVGSMPWSDITECIVVDNGSTDGTAALAASAGARVVVSSRGYGAACKAGSDAAVDASTILVFMDGDPRECPIDHQLHQFGAEKIGQAEPEKVERTGSSRSSCHQSGSNR